MSSFSSRLRELRIKADLSRKALAQKVGISKSSINMYERGDREPGIATLEALADCFDVDVDYLVGRSAKNTKAMTMNEKMRSLRLSLGLTLEEVGNAVGVGKSTVRKWENGMIANMRRDKIEKIAAALHTTPSYLMGWDDQDAQFPANMMPVRSAKFCPLLGAIACGDPILAEENIETYIPVPHDLHCDFVLRCKGDSMIDANIKSGDYVYIRQQDIVENGEIAAVMVVGVDAEATLKRVYIEGDCITLMPCNATCSPKQYVGEQAATVRILGKAVAVTSKIQ